MVEPFPTPPPIKLPQEMPSLREMAFNLVGAGKDLIAGALANGVIMASDEIAKTRWDICFDCEFFVKYVSDVNHYRCSNLLYFQILKTMENRVVLQPIYCLELQARYCSVQPE